jgi:Tol biopolymer transport system component
VIAGLQGRPREVTPALHGRFAPDLSGQPQAGPWWSPDGSKVAYVRRDANLVVVSASGRHRWLVRTRQLVNTSWDSAWADVRVAWAPDGRRLAVSGRTTRTWIATLGRPGMRLLAARRTRDAAWSPDGRKLAYVRGDSRGNGQLWVVTSDGRRAHRLTNDVPVDRYAHFSNTSPVWSPDGRRVAFLSDRDGRGTASVFVIGADGRNELRLTRGLEVFTPPRWSRDGSRLAVLVRGSHGTRPLIVAADGGLSRLLPLLPPSEDWYERSVDWAWGDRSRRTRLGVFPLPGNVPVRWIVAHRDHAPAGRARLVGARSVLALGSTRLESISANGRLVAAMTYEEDKTAIDLIDLAGRNRRRLVRPFSTGGVPGQVQLSPDGRSVLYDRRTPVVVRIADGRVTRIATRPELGSAEWLRDGRVAYISRGGQLMFVRPGYRPHGTRLWLPGRPVNFSISPDARRVVYMDPRWRTWLLDRQTGRRRRVQPGLEPGPFSPDGRFVALIRSPGGNDGPGIDVVLYRADGKRIGSLIGTRIWAEFGTTSWSADGRWLTIRLHYSGWRPPPPAVLAYSTATRRVTRLPASGTFGSLVVGPGGRVVLARNVTKGSVLRTAVMVGRLAG